MKIDDNFFISLALKEAWKYQGLTYPNPAVGCCVVGKYGEILAVEAHQKAGQPHGEVLAIQSSYYKLTDDKKILSLKNSSDIHNFLIKNHNNIFKEISIYTTLEPCSHVGKTPSCATLISKLGFKKVFVGSNDFNEEASNGNDILSKSAIEIKEHIMKKECDNLLYPFFKHKEGRFVFFKLAQRLNGTFDGGLISSKESRIQTHAMRDVCDLLVIGGNTVRVDRPTLDARLINGKAPDILILSRGNDFDKTIPLFSVKNREVFIESDFSKLNSYKNIMIEGGSEMYKLSKNEVDLYLTYIAPKFGGENIIEDYSDEFEILNILQESKDIIMWMKRKI